MEEEEMMQDVQDLPTLSLDQSFYHTHNSNQRLW